MRIALALAVFAASASAIAEEAPRTSKSSRVPFVCVNSGEKLAGLNKICYYSCARSEGAVTVAAYEACPHWKPHFRLSRNAQFGPNEKSR
jgi:hypothetical protein